VERIGKRSGKRNGSSNQTQRKQGLHGSENMKTKEEIKLDDYIDKVWKEYKKQNVIYFKDMHPYSIEYEEIRDAFIDAYKLGYNAGIKEKLRIK
jgi:hypothetical protein